MARTAALNVGRSIGVAFDHGEDFFAALDEICRSEGIPIERLGPIRRRRSKRTAAPPA